MLLKYFNSCANQNKILNSFGKNNQCMCSGPKAFWSVSCSLEDYQVSFQ